MVSEITTTTATSIMPNSLESPRSTKIKTYTCALCDSNFTNCEEQRAHFKSDWHIYNLHQKMESQLPITEKEFQESLSHSSTRRKGKEKEWDEELPVRRYVVSKKLRHATAMSDSSERSDRGESLRAENDSVDGDDQDESESSDREEALGSQDDSVESDDQDESAESETSDVLDGKENYTANDAMTWRDGNEMRLSNGKVIGTKSHRRTPKKHVHHPVSPISDPEIAAHHQPQPIDLAYIASTSASFPIPHHERQLSRRDNMGIVGLTDPEKKALLATERKMIGLEKRARGGWEASVESKGNCQKHYRIGGSRGGKKMGGLEKRLG